VIRNGVLVALAAATPLVAASSPQATPTPVVLVTETGGLGQAAPERPAIAVYADGLVIRDGQRGRARPRDVAGLLARHADVLQQPAPAGEPCATDLPTAEVTVREPTGASRTVDIYGLGVCSKDSAASRLVDDVRALPLTGERPYSGPWVGWVVLADGAPGPADRWSGPTPLPGGWVPLPDGSARLVKAAGHRFALLPRVLLPSEARGAGPGDPVVSVTLQQSGPGPALRDPVLLVGGDGTWTAERSDGTWETGTLTPADLDAFARRVEAAGLFDLPPVLAAAHGPIVTFRLAWGGRASVTVRGVDAGLASGAYPDAVGAVRDAFLGLRPAETAPFVPAAVRVTWRPRRRPPATTRAVPGTGRLAARGGSTVLMGPAAASAWAAVGRRSWLGATRQGKRAFSVAVEPALPGT
jgi:hypothetical protein